MSLESILQTALRPREISGDDQWQVWEHKTLNIHRGVLVWRPQQALSWHEMSEAISQQAQVAYKVRRWRGFGFGVIVESPTIPEDIATIDEAIHTQAQSRGTWQWCILVCPPVQTAIGIHTWMRGYLTPVYQELLLHYQTQGFEIGSCKKEKDRLLQFITTIARLKGVRFAEFDPKSDE